jgi:hypothetical protein
MGIIYKTTCCSVSALTSISWNNVKWKTIYSQRTNSFMNHETVHASGGNHLTSHVNALNCSCFWRKSSCISRYCMKLLMLLEEILLYFTLLHETVHTFRRSVQNIETDILNATAISEAERKMYMS